MVGWQQTVGLAQYSPKDQIPGQWVQETSCRSGWSHRYLSTAGTRVASSAVRRCFFLPSVFFPNVPPWHLFKGTQAGMCCSDRHPIMLLGSWTTRTSSLSGQSFSRSSKFEELLGCRGQRVKREFVFLTQTGSCDSIVNILVDPTESLLLSGQRLVKPWGSLRLPTAQWDLIVSIYSSFVLLHILLLFYTSMEHICSVARRVFVPQRI